MRKIEVSSPSEVLCIQKNSGTKVPAGLPPAGTETFFLWGPRQAGKSTLLKSSYPEAYWVDLLKSDLFHRYAVSPERLREEQAERGFDFCVIDEIQKVPALLDEVHWLHENKHVQFALCGSSARKVRRGQVNLLGGCALRYELFGRFPNSCVPRRFLTPEG